MFFNLRKPCPHCPFRSDGSGYLHPERAREIAKGLKSGDWFACHHTTEMVEDETGEEDLGCVSTSEHCAGAMILLEKIDRPSTAMQLSERLRYPPEGFYDRSKLDMDSPVVDSLEAFVEHHAKESR